MVLQSTLFFLLWINLIIFLIKLLNIWSIKKSENSEILVQNQKRFLFNYQIQRKAAHIDISDTGTSCFWLVVHVVHLFLHIHYTDPCSVYLYEVTTHISVKDIFFLFAQRLELQGHKSTLSYRKHHILSNDQQYKFVKLYCLRCLYKPTIRREETTKTGELNQKLSPASEKLTGLKSHRWGFANLKH